MSAGFKLKNGTLLLSTEAPGGIYNAEQLRQVAKISEDGALIVKVTEDQRLAVVVAKGDLEKVSKDLSNVGLGVRHYQEGLHQATSCIGKLCSEYQQDALKSAIDITAETRDLKTGAPLKIAVNGCSKCCNPCHTMDISVVGDSSGYRISLGGKAEMLPEFGQFAADSVPSDKLPQLLRSVVQTYAKLAEPGESMQDLIERSGMGPFAKVLAPWSQDAGGDLDSPAFGEAPSSANNKDQNVDNQPDDIAALEEQVEFEERVEFDENSLQLDGAVGELALEEVDVDEFGGLDLSEDVLRSPEVQIADHHSTHKQDIIAGSAGESELDDISLDASIAGYDELDEIQLDPGSSEERASVSEDNLSDLEIMDLSDEQMSSETEEVVDFEDIGDLDAADLGLVAENELDLNEGILDKVDSEIELENRYQVQGANQNIDLETAELEANFDHEDLGSLEMSDLNLDEMDLVESPDDITVESAEALELDESFETSSARGQVEESLEAEKSAVTDPELSDDIENLETVIGTEVDVDDLEKMVDEEVGSQKHLAEIADDHNELERLETLSLLDDDMDSPSTYGTVNGADIDDEEIEVTSTKQTSLNDKRNIASIKKINPERNKFNLSDIEFNSEGNLSLNFTNGLTIELGEEVFAGGSKSLKIAGHTLNIQVDGDRKQIEFDGIKLSIPEMAA